MTERVTVLHVLGSGAAHAKALAHTLLNLASQMDPGRYRLSALFLDGDGPLGDQLRAAGVAVRGVQWRGSWKDLRGAVGYARAVRESGARIVHIHVGSLSPRLVAKIAARTRIVVHYHSIEEEARRGPAVRRSASLADAVIANSRATAATVRGKDTVVVYAGVAVTPRAVTRHRSAQLTLGTAARLVPVKGIAYLLSAMKQIVREHPGVILEVAGAGPERNTLERIALSEGIADSIRFLGWRDDVGALMSGWDIYVQPSIAEGLGIAVLEAMAAGLPVVATAVGGLPETTIEGSTGYLVASHDPTALARRIGELAVDATLRTSMGDSAREHVREHFSPEAEVTAIDSVYRRLLS